VARWARFAAAWREYDPETGFYHVRARYHDPASQRFIQEDPSGGGNPYAYGDGNPTNGRDVNGLSKNYEWSGHGATTFLACFYHDCRDAWTPGEGFGGGGITPWDLLTGLEQHDAFDRYRAAAKEFIGRLRNTEYAGQVRPLERGEFDIAMRSLSRVSPVDHIDWAARIVRGFESGMILIDTGGRTSCCAVGTNPGNTHQNPLGMIGTGAVTVLNQGVFVGQFDAFVANVLVHEMVHAWGEDMEGGPTRDDRERRACYIAWTATRYRVC
jgi:RHS repeat-associated protein